jgi:hypothetical protein
MTQEPSIVDLADLAACLPTEDRSRFDRIFHCYVADGKTAPPEAMHGWLARQFGSVEAVRRQRIVRVGAMELFAQSIVTTDPFRVAEALRRG